jgi:hypothetical protein
MRVGAFETHFLAKNNLTWDGLFKCDLDSMDCEEDVINLLPSSIKDHYCLKIYETQYD